jgi:glutaredoxin
MSEEYILPSVDNYTIYSKSGCPNCTKAKNLIKSENPEIIDCDEYILENKEDFLEFIKKLAGKECKTFPMIFYKSVFIGGFNELKEQYEKMNAFTNL